MVHSKSLTEPLLAPNVNFADYPSLASQQALVLKRQLKYRTYSVRVNGYNGVTRECLLMQLVMDPSTLLNRSSNVLWINAGVTFIS